MEDVTQQPGQDQQGPDHHRQSASLWRQFKQEHYVNDVMIHMDTVFYMVTLIMTPIQRVLLTSPSQRMFFQAVIAASAAALTVSLFLKPLYKRMRPHIVLGTHLLTTALRAAAIFATRSNQAVGWRGPALLIAKEHRVSSMLMSMVAVTAIPMRVYEVLGLQQSFNMHVLVTAAFLAMHPYAALSGARLAYSNTLFLNAHKVHDLVAAVVEGLLSALCGIPASQQLTCSSCAGLVVYCTLGLFGSVAAPLWLSYVMEQSAYRHWCKQRGSRVAADEAVQQATARGVIGTSAMAAEPQAVASSDNSASGSSSSFANSTEAAMSSTGASSSSRGSMVSITHEEASRRRTQMDLIIEQTHALAAADVGGLQTPTLSLAAVLACNNMLVRWCVHALILALLLVVSWLVSNAVALVLLPRVLNRQQLDLWCPNRPYAPYVIAGQVYEGL